MLALCFPLKIKMAGHLDLLFKIFFFFEVDHFLKKSLLNLLQYCFCFMF